MDIRVITLRYQEGSQGFPEAALRQATSGREVLEAREHFFTHGNVPHLALVLMLGDGPSAGEGFRPRDPNAPNPEELVPEDRRPLYRDLKKWRNNPKNRNNNNGFRLASTLGQDRQGPIRQRPGPADAGTNMHKTGRLVAPAKVAPDFRDIKAERPEDRERLTVVDRRRLASTEPANGQNQLNQQKRS